jgi:hypothetical protein
MARAWDGTPPSPTKLSSPKHRLVLPALTCDGFSMGYIAIAAKGHFQSHSERLPPAVFVPTRQGFLAAYRHELLKDSVWQGDDWRLRAIISNAERTISTHLVLWRHDTAEAERAFDATCRVSAKVTLTKLRALPEGAAYKRFKIAINYFQYDDSGAFGAWLESHGHETSIHMRHDRPSIVDGREVRIGPRPARDRSEEERVLEFLHRLYINETRRPLSQVHQ